MKPNLILAVLWGVGVANATSRGKDPVGHEFIPAGPDDSRSPCPWLNALANHGYLPRDGRSITRELVEKAFDETLNIVPGTLEGPTAGAISTGKRGDGTFDLEDSVKHNVVEHDGSFSRNDAAIGNALVFDPVIWNRTVSHFRKDTVSVECVAAARLDRLATAQTLNPLFKLTPEGLTSTFINHALWLITFGDRVKGNANKQFLRIIFEQERLAFREGFVRPKTPIGGPEVVAMVGKLQAATVKIGLSQIPKDYNCANCS
jgi:hypothetical protein